MLYFNTYLQIKSINRSIILYTPYFIYKEEVDELAS